MNQTGISITVLFKNMMNNRIENWSAIKQQLKKEHPELNKADLVYENRKRRRFTQAFAGKI